MTRLDEDDIAHLACLNSVIDPDKVSVWQITDTGTLENYGHTELCDIKKPRPGGRDFRREELQLGILGLGIETGTGLGDMREVSVAENLGFGVVLP